VERDTVRHDGVRRRRPALTLSLLLLLSLCLFLMTACESEDGDATEDTTTSSSEGQSAKSGDVAAEVGEPVTVGNARVMVNALQETFQPVLPVQRLSEQTPSAPEAGESFYQAYVRVENLATDPVRVDATDFSCLVGNTVVAIEPTRSGPLGRSLLKNTSLDLILTFKAEAGFVPELRYNPPWYQGSIRVTPVQEQLPGDTTSGEEETGQEAPADEETTTTD
jgi:hypothetical protein